MERFLPWPLHMSSLAEQWSFPDSSYQQVEHHLQSTSISCAGLKIAWQSAQQEGRVAFPLLIMERPCSHSTTGPWLRDSSYCPVHSCFAKSYLSQGSPCPRRWKQATPLELTVQLLTSRHLISASCGSSHSCMQVVCEKLLG